MTFKQLAQKTILVSFAALALIVSITAQNLTVKEIMKEPSVAGARISGERLSPDGKWVLYLWNAGALPAEDLYLVSASGGDATKVLTASQLADPPKEKEEKTDPLEYGVVVNDDFVKARRGGIGNIRWSPDSSKILFTQNGDIYLMNIADKTPKRVTKTESSEFSADFLDNERILFQQSGNLFSINTKDGTLTQISKEANSAKNISVFGASASKDGSMMAYMTSDSSGQRPLFVPNYLPYYTAAPTVRRGWTKSKVYAAPTDGDTAAVEIKLPEQEGEAYIAGMEWMADNKTLIVDRVDMAHKRRQVFLFDTSDENNKAITLFDEEDEKWIGGPSRILLANPSNPNLLVIGSESGTGYMHLYQLDFVRPKSDEKWGITKQSLTDGKFEISWAKWFDAETIIFMSTADGASERTFHYVKTGTSRFEKLVDSFKGMRSSPQFENGTLIFGASDWRTPEDLLAIRNVCLQCRDIKIPTRLSNTVPEAFMQRKWNAPKITEFKARDGIMIPAKMYFPLGFDKKKKSPMVIFVHGAGYLQNVINGWNNYYREFMFNQMLTQKGYVVLDIDYRGSAGYGRDFRTDVYDFLGGKDYEDHVDGIDFMVREYNVDVNRVGVYGGSYGGFMAAMLVMRSPDKIKAAAALRPVMDWKNYYAANPFYTSQRLGDPKKNPEAYKRSSPIAYADKLEKKLLILHGMLDDNVHVQDSVQLVEQLMRLDKTEYFELMMYPSERHGFERPSSWEDEYERILALFENELN